MPTWKQSKQRPWHPYLGMTTPLVSVIILNYNGVEHLPVCLDSLNEQHYPNLELIVADNGSSDASKEVCSGYAGVNFVDLGFNYGYSQGNNAGASQASGKYLFFVNNDMRFKRDMIGQLVEAIESDESIFAVDSKQYDWSGCNVIHSATYFTRAGGLRSQFCPFVTWKHLDATEVVPVPWAHGATVFCRQSMFLELGGFDPTFFIDYEDTDLCWRAWLRGWKTLYVPHSECFHKVAATFSAESDIESSDEQMWTTWKRRRYFSGQKNRVRFIMKTMGWQINSLTYARNHLLAAIFVLQGKLVNASTMLRSWWSNIRELPEIMTLRRQILNDATLSSEQLIETFLI